MSDFYYLDLSLELAQDDSNVSIIYLKKNIINSLRQIFGEISSSVNIDILKYDSCERRAIIRVPAEQYVKLRSSLTLCSTYENISCAYKIHNISPSLLSLIGNSRTYSH
ncbi:ribonuclease P protein subunit p14 [Ctenocephalides felis]|uniref:ribonuclease P protein subunit p14 n=1 Tax=Ctenocephalides felis TaxID=7515 RepID=UPI000E6E2550|nr:ribonuclease P protein subunit p14 [Ctenocephalides felis]